MAAPTNTPRGTPTGFYLHDGYSTRIAFSLKPNVAMWIVSAKPPGTDGGEPIPITTMHNTKVRTFDHRHLLTREGCTIKFAFDPDGHGDFDALINSNSPVTLWWPDDSSLDFFGGIQKVEWDEFEEGKMPTGTATIYNTSYDPVNGVEADWVFTPAAGT